MTRPKPQPVEVPENITLVGPPEGAPDAESLPPTEYPPTEGNDPRSQAGAVIEGHGHVIGTTSLRPLNSQGRVVR